MNVEAINNSIHIEFIREIPIGTLLRGKTQETCEYHYFLKVFDELISLDLPLLTFDDNDFIDDCFIQLEIIDGKFVVETFSE